MHTRLNASVVISALLAGAAAGLFQDFTFPSQNGSEAPRADEFAGAPPRSAVVGCREAVQMDYDVRWAAACLAQADRAPGAADGHAECDLPDDQAAVINAWLNEAERRCSADGRHP